MARIEKVNYYQVFNTERGVHLRAMPSGHNNGGCIWELHGTTSDEKILLVNSVAQHPWRSCQPLELSRLKASHAHRSYKLVLLTKNALATAPADEQRLAETIKRINTGAEGRGSTTVVLWDDTLCIDLIPRITVQPEGRVETVILH